MSEILKEHEVTETLTVDIYYPDHTQRVQSGLFTKTKHELIDVRKTTCWICDTLDQLEVHHFHVEWAMSDAIDWDKMKTLHPNFDWSTFKTPTDFVDSEYNMMVLCQKHHRHKDYGIHMIPYPVWVVQKELLPNFIEMPPINAIKN